MLLDFPSHMLMMMLMNIMMRLMLLFMLLLMLMLMMMMSMMLMMKRRTGKVSIILGTIEGLQYKRCTSGGYKRSKIWGYQRTRHQQILCKRVSIYVSLENQFSSGDESSIACQKICTMISS